MMKKKRKERSAELRSASAPSNEAVAASGPAHGESPEATARSRSDPPREDPIAADPARTIPGSWIALGLLLPVVLCLLFGYFSR